MDRDSASTSLDKIGEDLGSNIPASELAERLKRAEAVCANNPKTRAVFLQYRGIVTNRLGLSAEALGDLTEAKGLFAAQGDAVWGAATCREIARVQAWRGEGRDAALALLQAFAMGGIDNHENVALSTLESGRLHFEIGRLAEAQGLFRLALDVAAGALPPVARLRTQILLVQTLVQQGRLEDGERMVAEIDLAHAPDRTRHLAAIEMARIAWRRGDVPEAETVLADLKASIPTSAGSFESAERDEVEAEVGAAAGHLDAALTRIRRVVARFAEDDLGGREVVARLREAEILSRLDREDEASRTLLAALHSAIARGLTGYADIVRAELSRRSLSVLAWMPGSAPTHGQTSLSQDRFVRRRPLGEGGFGSVSSAYDLESGEEIALKRLRLAEIYDTKARAGRLESARHEAAAASRLQHPGIGRVYGLIVDEDGEGLLVRELIKGPTLREALGETLPIASKLSLLTEFTQAVAAIHAADIVHRDLKPENIVLKNGRHPVVIDFGASTLGATDQSGGFNALYAAPEQLAGETVDRRADLFAVGMIAVEIILGRKPERARPGWWNVLRRRRRARRLTAELTDAGLSHPAAQIIVRTLALRPSARPHEVAPLVAALQARA